MTDMCYQLLEYLDTQRDLWGVSGVTIARALWPLESRATGGYSPQGDSRLGAGYASRVGRGTGWVIGERPEGRGTLHFRITQSGCEALRAERKRRS